MASINGVSGSSTTSSIYNSVNRISGLASGLDTEGMIESLVKSYQTKINQLNQKVTKTEWKQDAYRSIISKLVGFADKYTSYASSTNLMASGFFSSAVKVLTQGEFKDSVSASGKTSSDISLDAVHQLATAAQYRTKSNLTAGETGTIAGAGVDLAADADQNIELSNLSGSLKLTYGTKTVSISFNETTDVDAMKSIRNKLANDQGINAEDVKDNEVLAELINQKLADQKITFTNGETESASERIKAVAGDDGSITFKELGTASNGVYISGASGNVGSQLGLSDDDLKNAKEKQITTINANNIKDSSGNTGLTRKMNSFEYLAGKNGSIMNMSLDGTTKQITMPRVGYEKDDDGNEKYFVNGKEVAKEDFAKEYTNALSTEVNKAFGGKVAVENKAADGTLQLEFKVKNEGSDLIINSEVGDALGIGSTATSYLNTSKSLKDLMGDKLDGLTAVKDADGNDVLDAKGKKQYDFTINGVKIGTYTEDTKLSDIMSDINKNADAGVQVAYSQTTQNFTFTAKATGADSQIEMGDDLAQAIFGSTSEPKYGHVVFPPTANGITLQRDDVLVDNEGNAIFGIDEDGDKYYIQRVEDKKNGGYVYAKLSAIGKTITHMGVPELVDPSDPETAELFAQSRSGYTAGQDAKFTVTVNGEQKTMTRSSNSVSIDGLTINMSGTFNSKATDGGFEVEDAKKSVTFQSKTDSDKIVDAIKSMVSDYNTMMSEIKSAYSTMPYQSSSGSFANYEPLTDDDREGMSESAIERYETKAKQGILFGDRSLSTLYSEMSEAFSFTSREDIDALKDMGITIGYDISSGTQTVQVDEEKLRAMLDSDPDKVADLFTKSDGIMDRMKTQLDTYAKTTGEPKGILIQQAGSPLSSMSLMSNSWQQEIDDYNTQIEKWQDKLSSQVDRYTAQFSRLELLINQMNSQSSTLQSMMGG
ncbi:MAG: flagellar filament capping protein FliD [Oscillibacter sp.]|nr:flagellar filament capping protein FliD [Oscillibacter sp.]